MDTQEALNIRTWKKRSVFTNTSYRGEAFLKELGDYVT